MDPGQRGAGPAHQAAAAVRAPRGTSDASEGCQALRSAGLGRRPGDPDFKSELKTPPGGEQEDGGQNRRKEGLCPPRLRPSVLS